jgi:hypothetical protein
MEMKDQVVSLELAKDLKYLGVMIDGQLLNRGSERWCVGHHCAHGFLHCCELYSPKLQEEIRKLGDQFRSECRSGNINVVINRKNRRKWKDLQPEDLKL